MNIICPECGKIHWLPAARLPARKSAAKCKKCGARMIVDPQGAPNESGQSNSPAEAAAPSGAAPQEFDILLTDYGDDDQEEKPLSPSTAAAPDRAPAGAGTTMAEAEIYAAFPELPALSPEKFLYREIFASAPDRGYQTGDNRLKLKIVKAVHDLLTAEILHENEQVLRLARGIAYYPFEIPYGNGLLTIWSNYFAIVCTNQRLLLINIDGRTRYPTRYLYQIPYDAITRTGRGVFLSALIIKSKNGPHWNFTTVGRNLAKSIRDFILERNQPEVNAPQPDHDLWQLCPACRTPLPGGLDSCSHCAITFKKPAEAMLRALILPGLGSIYLGYLPLGSMEIAGYLATWLLAVGLMILQVPGGLATALAPVVAYHLAAGFLARHTAGKGYLVDSDDGNQPLVYDKQGAELKNP